MAESGKILTRLGKAITDKVFWQLPGERELKPGPHLCDAEELRSYFEHFEICKNKAGWDSSKGDFAASRQIEKSQKLPWHRELKIDKFYFS